MAIGLQYTASVQTGGNITHTSHLITANVHVGDIIVVSQNVNINSPATPTTLSISDDNSAVYQQIPGSVSRGDTVGDSAQNEIWYAVNTVDNLDITVSLSSTEGVGTWNYWVFVLSGVDTVTPVIDAQAADDDPSSPVTTPSVTSARPAFYTSIITGWSGPPTTYNSPWTGVVTSGYAPYEPFAYYNGPAGTFSNTATDPIPPSGLSIAAFQEASSGPSDKQKSAMNLVF